MDTDARIYVQPETEIFYSLKMLSVKWQTIRSIQEQNLKAMMPYFELKIADLNILNLEKTQIFFGTIIYY